MGIPRLVGGQRQASGEMREAVRSLRRAMESLLGKLGGGGASPGELRGYGVGGDVGSVLGLPLYYYRYKEYIYIYIAIGKP